MYIAFIVKHWDIEINYRLKNDTKSISLYQYLQGACYQSNKEVEHH